MSRVLFVLLFLISFFPLELFASVGFFSLLPNPSGDDTLGEYIEIRNTGCTERDISGYTITDAGGKKYVFPTGQVLSGHTTIHLEYSTTRISLNNSWDESVTLQDSLGNMIDFSSYSWTQRDDVIINIPMIDDICPEEPPDTGSGGSSGTGSSGTGTVSGSGSGSISGTGSSDTGSGNTWTGITGTGSSDTGSGSVGTGSVDTGSGLSGTGGSSGSGMNNSWSLSLQPFHLISLQYDDTDGNRKIDTLIIEYSLELSGSINVNTLWIFSRSWWLATTKIDTATGYIQSASFSGRFLILKIIEQDLEKDILHVTNTTSSDLRLKTLWLMGFTSIFGQVPPDFLLTSSFSNYQNVTRYSSNIESWIGMVWSGNISLWSGVFLFPEIIPVLQSPTNASLSGSTFTCSGSNLPCRINLTLEPLFIGWFPMRDYICEVWTGGVILIDCNPNTLYFVSTGSVMIRLIEKSHPENYREKLFSLIFTPVSSHTVWVAQISTIDMNPPIIILEYDGKWKEYYEQVNDTELNCYTDTCSLNFTAERSYDHEWWPVRFMWMYDMWDLTTSRDPWVRKFNRGDHDIWLRVIDQSGNWSGLHYTIHVLGPKPKIEKIALKKTKEKKLQEILSASVRNPRKTKTSIRMEFFSPPEILTQWKTLTGKVNTYSCITTRKSCQINLTLTGNTRAYSYSWELSDGTMMTGKNPKWWILPVWSHSVFLRVYKKWETLEYYSQKYTLEVLKKKTIKKAKKKKIKKQKPLKSSQKKWIASIVPEANAMSTTSPDTNNMTIIPFFLWFSLYIFLKRKSIFPKNRV